MTTLGGDTAISRAGADSLRRLGFDSLGARNLRIQKAHRVKLAVGSDEYHNTPVPEVMYLHGLGVFRASSPAVRHFEFIPA